VVRCDCKTQARTSIDRSVTIERRKCDGANENREASAGAAPRLLPVLLCSDVQRSSTSKAKGPRHSNYLFGSLESFVRSRSRCSVLVLVAQPGGLFFTPKCRCFRHGLAEEELPRSRARVRRPVDLFSYWPSREGPGRPTSGSGRHGMTACAGGGRAAPPSVPETGSWTEVWRGNCRPIHGDCGGRASAREREREASGAARGLHPADPGH
jgi:hypothetical protein